MNKKIRLSVLILTMVVIFNLFLASNKSVADAGFFSDNVFYAEPHVEIDFDQEIALDPLLPIDKTKVIPITMNLSITGYYSDEMMDYIEGSKLFADLKIVDYPDYCEAAIAPKKLGLPLEKGGLITNATLSLVINKTGRALERDLILIELIVLGGGSIVKRNFTKEIEFIPGYLPFLEFETESKTKKVTPDETAEFKINVKNRGNARTNVSFEIMDKPKDWIIKMPENIELEGESDITLSVRGPKSFGYHNDREKISIKVVPAHYKNLSLKGQEYFLNFIVQSKGFSTPGFESITVLFAFIIGFFILKSKKKKYRKKGGDYKDES